MVPKHDSVKGVLLKDRLMQMWPEYPCLYDARGALFKSRDVRQLTIEERLHTRSHFKHAASDKSNIPACRFNVYNNYCELCFCQTETLMLQEHTLECPNIPRAFLTA